MLKRGLRHRDHIVHDAKGRWYPLSEVSPINLHGWSGNSFKHPLGIPRADKILSTEVSPCFAYIVTYRSLFLVNWKRPKKIIMTVLRKKPNRLLFKRYISISPRDWSNSLVRRDRHYWNDFIPLFRGNDPSNSRKETVRRRSRRITR